MSVTTNDLRCKTSGANDTVANYSWGEDGFTIEYLAEANAATALPRQGMDEIDYVHLAFHQHTMQQAVQAI